MEVLEAVVRRCSVKRCSYKFHKIYRKTPVSTKNRLWHRHFPVKTPFLHKTSRYLSFCLGLLVMYKNGLIRKIRLISKFMTSHLSKLATAIHILPNISRSKDNQTMKSGQLIEWKKKTFLLKNHTQNMAEKLFPEPFLRNQNITVSKVYLWINSLKVLYNLFLLYANLRAIWI